MTNKWFPYDIRENKCISLIGFSYREMIYDSFALQLIYSFERIYRDSGNPMKIVLHVFVHANNHIRLVKLYSIDKLLIFCVEGLLIFTLCATLLLQLTH